MLLCTAHHECGDPNSVPLQEQHVLLTTVLSLQPQENDLICDWIVSVSVPILEI